MRKIIPFALCMMALFLLSGCAAKPDDPAPKAGRGEKLVGTDVAMEDVTEFYYTVDASTDPPHYQRYRFYAEEGKYYFFHQKREGDHWPLTEDDATVTGTVELTDAEWGEFFACLRDGTVVKRTESLDSGGRGPWLYLYWNGDKSKYQEFSFASLDRRAAFEELCEKLASR
jgi:hypothetical protein